VTRNPGAAYATRIDESWLFTDIVTGKHLDRNGWSILVLNRRDYFLHILELPRAGEGEIRSMLGYRLKALHPAEPENLIHDYLVLSEGKTLLLAVVVMTREMKELYQSVLDKRILAVLFQLPDPVSLRRQSGELVLHWEGGGTRETLLFRDGFLSDSPIKGRLRRPHDTAVHRESLPLSGFPLTGRIRPLFSGSRGGAVGLKPMSVVNISLAFVVLLLFVLIQFVDIRQAGISAQTEKELYEKVNAEWMETIRLEKEIAELERRLAENRAADRIDACRFSEDVILLLDPDSSAEELSLEGKQFQVRIQSDDPISLIDRFDKSERFSEIVPSVITPVKGTSQKVFTIKGQYNG
jgi:hypothetical protein